MIAALIAASYPTRNIRVVNAGIGGNKIHDLLGRLDRDVLVHKPDWVTVSIGINDVWHGLADNGGRGGVSIETYREGSGGACRSDRGGRGECRSASPDRDRRGPIQCRQC